MRRVPRSPLPPHPNAELWDDWKWSVSSEERSRILTELTRFSETLEGGYQ